MNPSFSTRFLVTFAVLLLCLGAYGQSREEVFLKGNIAYGNGNYEEAEQLYRQILAEVESAEVHYNLGNTLAQQSRLSEAAYHYMRAYSLNPNLEAAQANLMLVANRMGLSKDYPKLPHPARLLAERNWITIAAISFWLALILFFHRDFVRFRIPLSRTLGTLSVVILVATIVAIVQHRLYKEWAIISDPLVSLRVAPTQQSPGESVLIEGDPVRIIGEQKGFFHVMTASGAEGFILHEEAYSLGND